MRDCQYCNTRNLERDEPHTYGCPGLTIERLRDQRTVLSEQLTDKCDELKAAAAEIEQLRNHLIVWSNGCVRCIVCRMSTHGGERIPHETDCIMDGYTKQSYHGPAVLSLPTKSSDPEYPRASDARGPTQTHEKAESSRHQGSDDACADRDHRAPDSGRLQSDKNAGICARHQWRGDGDCPACAGEDTARAIVTEKGNG